MEASCSGFFLESSSPTKTQEDDVENLDVVPKFLRECFVLLSGAECFEQAGDDRKKEIEEHQDNSLNFVPLKHCPL